MIGLNDLTDEQIEITRRTYDNRAYRYAEIVERSPKIVSQVKQVLIDPMLEFIGSSRSLEIAFIGCGTGRDIEHFTKLGFKCYGYDFSSGMLDEAAKHVSNIPLTLLDITKDYLPKTAFDFF